MANGTTANVDVGIVGWLYVAPIDTTEPSDASTALPSAWRAVGYTEDGWTWTNELTSEDIEVAEELEPIDTKETRRLGTLSAQLAEVTRANLALALNHTDFDAASDASALEPPELNATVNFMAVWDALETPGSTNIRRLFRKLKNVSNIEIAQAKAPQKSLIPVEFRVLKPTGLAAWKTFPNASGLIA
jgi:hypothetical protein